MINVKGALFDLDGVLIDSEGIYTEFWAKIGVKYNQPSPTFALDIKGSTLKEILSHYFPNESVQEAVKTEIHEFEQKMIYRIFPGVNEYILKLKNEGVKIAIVTSSDDKKMDILKTQHPEFISLFDVIVNASMVTKSKPDPEGYRKAADMLNLKPEECVVMEDSFQGLEAGRRLGGKVIAIATTNPKEKLQGLADKVIDSFYELM